MKHSKKQKKIGIRRNSKKKGGGSKKNMFIPIVVEQKEIKTVSPKNASAYLNGFRESKSKHSGNYIVGIADTVLMEDISNTSEQLAVIPAKTVHRNLKSRILLLEIDGKVESVVFSTHAYDSSTAQSLSRLNSGQPTRLRWRSGVG